MTSQVLSLAQIVYLHPMGDDRRPDLIQVLDGTVDLSQMYQQMAGDIVKMFSVILASTPGSQSHLTQASLSSKILAH